MTPAQDEPFAALLGRPFLKMNGLGNDFVVLDARAAALTMSPEAARAIADRQTGIGCDQIVLLESSLRADVFMRILNADGSRSGACGNATRCVARLIMDETGKPAATIDTEAGVLAGFDGGNWSRVRVDMGKPRTGWRDIPLARPESDTARLELDGEALPEGWPRLFGAVSMGNPHAVFFVDDAAGAPLERAGPAIERHPLFPMRANVSAAEVRGPNDIMLRVWERGVGLTRACGTAACAALVTAARLGMTARNASVALPGGVIDVEWTGADHVMMTGDVEREFAGVFTEADFRRALSR